jgi:hypothetical protein
MIVAPSSASRAPLELELARARARVRADVARGDVALERDESRRRVARVARAGAAVTVADAIVRARVDFGARARSRRSRARRCGDLASTRAGRVGTRERRRSARTKASRW